MDNLFDLKTQKLYISDILNGINNGQVFVCEKKDGNKSEIYYCINEDQVKQVINFLTQLTLNRADSFYEMCKTTIVYDGLCFGITRDLRDKIAKDNLIDDKIHYLEHFNYICDGVEFSFIDYTPALKVRLSKYPFDFTHE